jgi:4a-hydroxytetrahydrobiopterin dehydratase
MTLQPPPGWDIVDGHRLHRKYAFPDFKTALDFVNRVGAIAEAQNHHPDIVLGWGKVEITTYTHTANGLTEKDYKLAAAIG